MGKGSEHAERARGRRRQQDQADRELHGGSRERAAGGAAQLSVGADLDREQPACQKREGNEQRRDVHRHS
jgi:hypothetical protein